MEESDGRRRVWKTNNFILNRFLGELETGPIKIEKMNTADPKVEDSTSESVTNLTNIRNDWVRHLNEMITEVNNLDVLTTKDNGSLEMHKTVENLMKSHLSTMKGILQEVNFAKKQAVSKRTKTRTPPKELTTNEEIKFNLGTLSKVIDNEELDPMFDMLFDKIVKSEDTGDDDSIFTKKTLSHFSETHQRSKGTSPEALYDFDNLFKDEGEQEIQKHRSDASTDISSQIVFTEKFIKERFGVEKKVDEGNPVELHESVDLADNTEVKSAFESINASESVHAAESEQYVDFAQKVEFAHDIETYDHPVIENVEAEQVKEEKCESALEDADAIMLDEMCFTDSDEIVLSDNSEDSVDGILRKTPTPPNKSNKRVVRKGNVVHPTLIPIEESRFDETTLRPCWIPLQRIEETVDGVDELIKAASIAESGVESATAGEITRLLDLSSLERKRRGSQDGSAKCTTSAKKRRQNAAGPSNKSDSGSSGFDDFLPENDSRTSPPPVEKMPQSNERDEDLPLLDLMEWEESDSVCSQLSFDADSEGSVDETEPTKEKKKDQLKENSKKSSKPHDPSSNWKKDKLLTSSLGNESDDEFTTEQIERLERQKQRIDDKIEQDIKNEVFEFNFFTDEENDSEIEFISYTKNKRKYKKRSKSDDSSSSDSTSSDGTTTKSGRKNIRKLLNDAKLTKATQKANHDEMERLDRLNKKRKEMDRILSMSQLEEESLVLDATENTVVKVDQALVERLKPHQKKGVRFMWDACYESVKTLKNRPGSGCVLAHCMGLGKTFQVVTLIHTLFAHELTNTKHVLIVCPLSTVLNWENEFRIGLEKIEKTFNIYKIGDLQKNRDLRIYEIDKWRKNKGVLLMGYESFTALTRLADAPKYNLIVDALVNPGADLIVCDEGHLLKNDSSQRTKALMAVRTRRRIVLTGTPMQNNLMEYYHMVQFIKANILGTKKEFQNRFVNPINNGQYHDSTNQDIFLMKKRSHVLHQILENTVQRFEVTELNPYLPPKLDHVIFVRLSEVQALMYNRIIKLLLEGNSDQKKLFNHFHLLHTIWTHPYLVKSKEDVLLDKKKKFEQMVLPLSLAPNWWVQFVPHDFLTNISYGPKFEVMITIIEECQAIDDKLLIFSSSIHELDLIQNFLQEYYKDWVAGEHYFRLDGSVPVFRRQEYCEKFNAKNKKVRLVILTPKVGGMGLNLHGANRVILMDVSWNPAHDTQSIFRIYRLGQEKPCFVYRLVSKGTMEEVIYERSITKQAIAGRVVDEMQIERHYKNRDLQEMYRCNLLLNTPRPLLKCPGDNILATLIQKHESIWSYHEQETLLSNLPDEELDEAQQKIAWDEFNKEKEQHCEMPPLIPITYPLPPALAKAVAKSVIKPVVPPQVRPAVPPQVRPAVPLQVRPVGPPQVRPAVLPHVRTVVPPQINTELNGLNPVGSVPILLGPRGVSRYNTLSHVQPLNPCYNPQLQPAGIPQNVYLRNVNPVMFPIQVQNHFVDYQRASGARGHPRFATAAGPARIYNPTHVQFNPTFRTNQPMQYVTLNSHFAVDEVTQERAVNVPSINHFPSS